jgi:hypothetical protein
MIKDLMGYYLKEWVGATLQEYQSSGHELDVLAMTPDGISIYVEVIWSASLQNFYRDMFMIQNSDANIKVVIANPKLLADEKCQRIFEKAAIAQRKLGVAMHGELIDGERVLSDKTFVESELKAIILKLIEHVQKYGKTIGRNPEITLPEPQIVDRIEEDLLSNLFPIVSFPATIYSSPTRARRVGEVFRTLGPIVDDHPFLPKNMRLYTFDNLSDPSSVFAPLINKDEVLEESSSVWLNDEVRRNDLVYLFNLALEKYCRKRNMRYDRNHDRYVCLLKDGKDYSFGWRAKTKYIERKVARRVCKDGQLVFCIHYAAKINFMYINESLFLKMEPTKVFTSDGFKPIRKEKLASLMSRYLSKEYNSLYLSSVRFWTKFLSKLDAKLSIPIGNQLIEIDTNPADTHMQVGIAHEEISR